jgi:hypothetical protein
VHQVWYKELPMTAPARPETLVREYRSTREQQRDTTRLARAGWEVVSVLERPAPPGWVRRTTGGRVPWPERHEVERLVTYVWRGRGTPAPTTRAPGALGARWLTTSHVRPVRQWRWRWWLALVLVLLVVLLIGLLSFFGDSLLPG